VIDAFNNTGADAAAVAAFAKPLAAHVNVIPVNPARGGSFRATREDARAFAGKLAALGVNATVRRTLGSDIEAACGQLRAQSGSGS